MSYVLIEVSSRVKQVIPRIRVTGLHDSSLELPRKLPEVNLARLAGFSAI
jgi:phosphoenolpyruvate carboxylase